MSERICSIANCPFKGSSAMGCTPCPRCGLPGFVSEIPKPTPSLIELMKRNEAPKPITLTPEQAKGVRVMGLGAYDAYLAQKAIYNKWYDDSKDALRIPEWYHEEVTMRNALGKAERAVFTALSALPAGTMEALGGEG